MQILKSTLLGAALLTMLTAACTVTTHGPGDDDDGNGSSSSSGGIGIGSSSSGGSSSGGSSSSGAPAANVSNTAYDALYDTKDSPSADPAKIGGLWKYAEDGVDQGVAIHLEIRLEIRDGKIKFTSRCSAEGYTTVTAGVTASGTAADNVLTVTDAGGSDKRTSTGPAGKPPISCSAKLTGPGKGSYELKAPNLIIFDTEFTKVTD